MFILLSPVAHRTHLIPILFRHAQISGDNLPNTVLFHVQLFDDHSNNQQIIDTHYIPYLYCLLNTYRSSIYISSLVLVFEPLLSLKNTLGQHAAISIHLLKHLKSSWQRFCFLFVCLFVCFVFCFFKYFRFVRSSVIIAEQPKKEEV